MGTLASQYVQIRGDTTRLVRDIDDATKGRSFPVKAILEAAQFRRDVLALLRDQSFKVRPVLDPSKFRAGQVADQRFKVFPVLTLAAFRAQFAIFRAVYLRDQTFGVHPHLSAANRAALISALAGAGAQGGAAINSGVGSSLAALPSEVKVIAIAAAVGIGVAMAPALGAALVAGILLAVGGGVLALGIASAVQDPRVAAAFGGLGAKVKALFGTLGESFKEPLIRAVSTFATALDKITPTIRTMVESMAPLVDKLAPALADLVVNIMPGLQAALVAAVPLFEVIADKAPALGTAFSKFFDAIAEGGPGAKLFLEDLFDFLIFIIPKLGEFLGWLAGEYVHFRNGVVAILDAIGFAWDVAVGAFNLTKEAIGTVLGLIGTAYTTTRDTILTVIAAIRTAWDIGWTFLRDKVFGPMVTFVTETLPNAFGRGKDFIGEAWDKIKAVVASPVRWVIDNVINRVVQVFNTVAGAIGVGKIPEVSAGFGDGGPVRSVGGVQFLAAGGMARRMSVPGLLRGPGGPREDKIPIWASNREYIVNARDTAWSLPILEWINSRHGRRPGSQATTADPMYAGGGLIGGLAGLWDAITNPAAWVAKQIGNLLDRVPGGGLAKELAVGAGKKLVSGLVEFVKSRLFAGGGPGGAGPGFLPWPSSPGAQRGDTGVWRSIMALVRASGIPYTFGNAYRPGDPLWHGSGRAVDLMGYNQDALGNFFLSRMRNVLELIHLTNRGSYFVTRGQRRSSMGIQGALHRNHLHVAMALGGLLDGVRNFDLGGAWRSGTLGINTSGGTEEVTPRPLMLELLDEIRQLRADLVTAIERVAPGVGRELQGTSRGMLQIARARS